MANLESIHTVVYTTQVFPILPGLRSILWCSLKVKSVKAILMRAFEIQEKSCLFIFPTKLSLRFLKGKVILVDFKNSVAAGVWSEVSGLKMRKALWSLASSKFRCSSVFLAANLQIKMDLSEFGSAVMAVPATAVEDSGVWMWECGAVPLKFHVKMRCLLFGV